MICRSSSDITFIRRGARAAQLTRAHQAALVAQASQEPRKGKRFYPPNLPAEIIDWFDLHFGPSPFHGRIQVGMGNGQGVHKLYMSGTWKLRDFLTEMNVNPRLDYYITANQVCGVERKAEDLFALSNIVLDVDCHDASVSPGVRQQALEWFLFLLDAQKVTGGLLPPPTSIVRSGRGVQLWWALKPIHVRCRCWYDEVVDYFLAQVEDLLSNPDLAVLHLDTGASRNAVGYFRLPGTFNSHTGTPVTVEISPYRSIYSVQQLIALVKTATEALQWKNRPPERPSGHAVPVRTGNFAGQYSQEDLAVMKNFNTVGFFRMRAFIELRMLRDRKIGEETRNNLNLLAYCALYPAFSHEEAWQRLLAFNSGFRQPMTEQELEGVICSARRKGGYSYSNRKIIEFLEITPEEQKILGLYAREEGAPEFQGDHASRRESRKLQKEDRDARIVALEKQGVPRREIARQVGVSTGTVTRVLADAGLSLQDRRQKILDLLDDGRSNKDIAQTVGVSVRTVLRTIQMRKDQEAARMQDTHEAEGTEAGEDTSRQECPADLPAGSSDPASPAPEP